MEEPKMTRWGRNGFVAAVVFAVSVGVTALCTGIEAAPGGNKPDDSTKTARLACKPGWRGTAVGEYGGVGFSVSCENGKGQTRLTGVVGTAYSVRMGVESDAVGVDCFFTGDSGNVRETCAEVTLTIR